ncbi:MAG: hypothetical protein JXB49_03765 [Bacteroidales bacterium]|nr:hypothetical protein [Bacteroidales bacterium]
MKTKLFIENRAMGGYSVAVQSDWFYRIRREHLTDEQRKIYEEEIGHEVLSEKAFNEWWFKVNNLKT